MIVILAWRNVWRNKLRSGIMIAAMIVGLVGLMLMVGFMKGMIENMVDNAIRYQISHLQVHREDFLLNEDLKSWIPDADHLREQLIRESGVAGVSARQVVNGMLGSAAGTRGVRINGIFPEQEIKVTALGEAVAEGKMLPPEGRNPILVSRRSAQKLKLKLGSKVVLTFSDLQGEVSGAAFRICGLFQTPASGFDEGNVYIRRADFATLAGTDQVHELGIRLDDADRLAEIKKRVEARVGDRGVVRDWLQIQPMLAAMIGSMDYTYVIVIGVFVLALGFGIINIMTMSVFERTREFGVLMAVGMRKTKLLQLILLESLFLGCVGSLCGMVASAAVLAVTGTYGLPLGAVAEGLGAFGVDAVIYTSVSPLLYILVAACVIIISMLASLYPTRIILRKHPHEAIMERH